MVDPYKTREDYPVLSLKVEGKNPIYFDNACMTLKPRQVIEAIEDYYNTYPGCGGRSAHKFALKVTMRYDEAREKLQGFVNASRKEEIIFTKNATEAINLVANSLWLKEGDMVLTTDKEHNSNLVPWHLLRDRKGVIHEVVPSNPDNTFNIENLKEKMSRKVKLVSLVHTSNLDGVTVPAREIIEIAHDYDALAMLDGAQSTPHREVDVQGLDVDFFALSVHKMAGPTGMGVLYGKYGLLENLEPFLGGGDTVQQTSYTRSEFLPPPEKFEAGLQNYAGAIGAGAAVDYLASIGMEEIHEHEVSLNRYISKGLWNLGAEIIGPEDPALRGGIVSFTIPGLDVHDIAMFVDEMANVMIRSGMHCVHSWFTARGMKGSARASVYLYNTKEEAKIFLESIGQMKEILG
ncbi:MAG: aminotransferase class V-fold PLP-dependent enzyme [Thermoplasmata archaeon]|nr:aminotransferase class V-fold PLP-dependent enzyme [Thermoplasmata archaeon]